MRVNAVKKISATWTCDVIKTASGVGGRRRWKNFGVYMRIVHMGHLGKVIAVLNRTVIVTFAGGRPRAGLVTSAERTSAKMVTSRLASRRRIRSTPVSP